MKRLFICLIIVLGIQSCVYAQAVLEEDIYAGDNDSGPVWLTEYDSKLYFFAYTSLTGNALMSYDGLSTAVEADIDPNSNLGSGLGYLTEYDGKLYFSGRDNINGSEIWSYDGTTTTMVSDMNPASYGYSVSYLTVFNGRLYFWNGGVTAGFDLWSYDGQSFSLEGSIASGNEDESEMIEYDGKLYFKALGELYSFDGTSISLELDINSTGGSYPSNMTVFDGKLFFGADDGVNGGELWSYDGVSGVLEADINPSGGAGPAGIGLAIFQNKLFFSAEDGTHGVELWSFDGTLATLEADIIQGADRSNPILLTVYAGKLFFFAWSTSSVGLMDLWSYDGISVSLEGDIDFPTDYGEAGVPAVYNDKLYFESYDLAHGRELWSFTDPSVGIDEIYTLSPTVYPNPGAGVFNISSSFNVQEVKVFNSIGQIVMTRSELMAKNVDIDLLGFADGIYTIRVLTDGEITYKKLIKSSHY